MRSLITCLALIVAVGGGHQAAAQTLSIEFRSGRVDLFADQATVPDILREWSRVGGSQFVNGDLVQGPPVTLDLVDVPERKALDVLLRNASGYTAVWRQNVGSRSSVLDKVFVIPEAASDTVPGRLTPFSVQPASSEQGQPNASPQSQAAGAQSLGIPQPPADQSGREAVRAEGPRGLGIPDPLASGERPAPQPEASGLPEPFAAQAPNPGAEAAARRKGSVGIPQPF